MNIQEREKKNLKKEEKKSMNTNHLFCYPLQWPYWFVLS